MRSSRRSRSPTRSSLSSKRLRSITSIFGTAWAQRASMCRCRIPLGADGAGMVVEVGAQSGNVNVGDAVCLYPPTGCGRCEFCITDQDFMCVYLRVLGERIEGTYAEYVKLPAQNCFPIPQGYSFEEEAAFPIVFITL